MANTFQLTHQFTVSEISIKGTPRPSSVFNEFDSHGTVLGLPRLPQERNADYKKRLLDVFARRASSAYIGLLNGITRELGLKYFKPITISISPSTPFNLQPSIEFIENKVYVYRDKATQDLELEIDRSTPGSDAYWLTDFVNKINSEATYLTAAIHPSQEPYTRTDTIINQSSAKIVNGLPLSGSNIHVLPNQKIERNSLVFTDTSTFRKEVQTEGEVNKMGRFYVDYENGIIKTFSVPPEGVRVRYIFHEDPFEPIATPVIIRNLQSDLFKEKMFQETISTDGSEALGIPTEFGATIINELMSVFPMYWGE